MTGTSKNRLRRLAEWWLQRTKLQTLIAQRSQTQGPAEQRLLEEARGSVLMAWRIMAGLEPISANLRSAVAAPLLVAALNKSRTVAAPAHTSFVELLGEPEWQQAFVSAGLPEPEQQAIREWLSSESTQQLSPEVAKGALIAARTTIESVDAPRRAIRALRRRRVTILGLFLAVLAGISLAAVALLRGPPPVDIAAGKWWNSSSAYAGYGTAGQKPVDPPGGMFFSTTEEFSPWWRVDLNGLYEVTGAEIVNRSDCCSERPWPLVLELSSDDRTWREVARREDQTSTWKPTFKPSPARYVRLRSLSRTFLHFRDVKVHGTPVKNTPVTSASATSAPAKSAPAKK